MDHMCEACNNLLPGRYELCFICRTAVQEMTSRVNDLLHDKKKTELGSVNINKSGIHG